MSFFNKFKLLTVGILAAWNLNSRSLANKSTAPVTMLIESCSDGDTCTARHADGFKLKLRLAGMDAPEISHGKKKGQAYGPEAKKALNSLVRGKKIKTQILGSDPYHRFLAILWDGNLNINEHLIREGHAFAYSGQQQSDIKKWAQGAQQHAEKNKKGLWALPKGDQPNDPSVFRKKFRSKNN